MTSNPARCHTLPHSSFLILNFAPELLLSQFATGVTFYQPLQQGDQRAKLRPALRVGHPAGAIPGADDRDARDDVDAVADRRFHRLEAVMTRQGTYGWLPIPRATAPAPVHAANSSCR